MSYDLGASVRRRTASVLKDFWKEVVDLEIGWLGEEWRGETEGGNCSSIYTDGVVAGNYSVRARLDRNWHSEGTREFCTGLSLYPFWSFHSSQRSKSPWELASISFVHELSSHLRNIDYWSFSQLPFESWILQQGLFRMVRSFSSISQWRHSQPRGCVSVVSKA